MRLQNIFCSAIEVVFTCTRPFLIKLCVDRDCDVVHMQQSLAEPHVEEGCVTVMAFPRLDETRLQRIDAFRVVKTELKVIQTPRLPPTEEQEVKSLGTTQDEDLSPK
ncbi:hypothetical protein RF11_10554 [Thelohanellus kitauei]|uniref:Uncharacterized protein n=1 Tax=Thelohanellus kitauei TaxID=669202 RepID=A0A0C2MMH3_THEKT|nr:hypothetical protein RF11_10554 [Thelohanellus kitauei]